MVSKSNTGSNLNATMDDDGGGAESKPDLVTRVWGRHADTLVRGEQAVDDEVVSRTPPTPGTTPPDHVLHLQYGAVQLPPVLLHNPRERILAGAGKYLGHRHRTAIPTRRDRERGRARSRAPRR